MEKSKNIIKKVKSWSLRRKIFFGFLLLVVIFIGYKNFGPEDNSSSIISESVVMTNLAKTVLATGQVTSKTDLSLSFNNSGIVRSVRVEVGDKVYKGQILANLDQGVELANVSKARASVAQAQAKYKKVVEGSTDTEIALAKTLLESAKNDYEKSKSQQDVLVENALNELNKRTYDAVDYDRNKFSYDSAVKTRDTTLTSLQAVINQRQAELDVKLATARDSDIELAKADILSAESELQSANSKFENTVLRAPSNGTITKVDLKLGELAQSLNEVMVLQDIGNLYLEADINEANIALVQIGQPVSITYDSLGPDSVFEGEVFSIDPASNNTDGIVNYTIKVSLKDVDKVIRPGMNANIVIKIFQKDNVLVVPLLSVYTEEGQSFVDLITNNKRKLYTRVPVTTGALGDGNLIEIQSGLNEGDSVVVINKK